MRENIENNKGFTLIEMIVSLGVFSVVVTISIGALLTIIATNQQLQKEQSVMTNLSFTLDSMTREIRTGTDYYCDSAVSSSSNMFDDSQNLDDYVVGGGVINDCPIGMDSGDFFQGIAFRESGSSVTRDNGERILYYFDKNRNALFRRAGNVAAQRITSSGIHIDKAEFFVTGTDKKSGGDERQPTVTIFIEAKDKKTDDKSYEVQTTITQRILDL